MTPATSPARRARLLVGALLVVVFAGGALTGAVVDRLVGTTPTASAPPTSERAAEDGERRKYVFEQLDLTPEQRARIDAALELRRAQTDSIWRATRPHMRAIIDSLRNDVRAVLTDAQREEYDRLLAERDAKRQQEREREQGKNGQH